MHYLRLRLAVCTFVLLFAIPSFVSAGGISRWSDLTPDAVAEDGLGNVIVLLSVPDLNTLDKASIQANGIAQTAQADATLNAAITQTADHVLARLDLMKNLGKRGDYRVNRQFDILPLLALAISPSVLDILLSDPAVSAIYPDKTYPLPRHGSTPLGSEQPSRPQMTETNTLIGATQAWEQGYTGQGWYVAILDTGIRSTHEFFAGKDIIEACFSSPSHCPNGEESMVGPGAAAHFPDTVLGFDHGTHVAGIAAGSNPESGLFGVARDAGIIAVNVFHVQPPEQCGPSSPVVLTNYSDVLAGMIYVYNLRGQYNIGAVNLSLGGGRFDSFCDDGEEYPLKIAIDMLRGASIPTIIATGNDSFCEEINSPSCISSSFPVMSSNKRDMESKFNNWNFSVGQIFAPGQSIISATGDADDSYEAWDGTSMAAPHVCGAMTLMRQVRPIYGPDILFERLTELGPMIATSCDEFQSKPRLYVDNFGQSQREKANILFDRLESEQPETLLPQPAATQKGINGEIYRYYETSNVTIGVYRGNVYFIDGTGTVHELGNLDDLI